VALEYIYIALTSSFSASKLKLSVLFPFALYIRTPSPFLKTFIFETVIIEQPSKINDYYHGVVYHRGLFYQSIEQAKWTKATAPLILLFTRSDPTTKWHVYIAREIDSREHWRELRMG